MTSFLISSTSPDTYRTTIRDPNTSVINILLTKISKIKLGSSGMRRLKKYVNTIISIAQWILVYICIHSGIIIYVNS